MLAIVQHQEHSLLLQGGDQRVARRQLGIGDEPACLRDGGEHKVRIPQWGEIDEDHAVRDGVGDSGGNLESQPCLADAAGT